MEREKSNPTSSAYERFLRTDELLSLQCRSDREVGCEELIFIVSHQSSELWLKMISRQLLETSQAIDLGKEPLALRKMRMADSYVRIMTHNLEALDSIAPREFLLIRSTLENGSGFSSPGWNSVRRLAEGLGKSFYNSLERRRVSLDDVYSNGPEHEIAYQLAEALVDFDRDCILWRHRHFKVIERLIASDGFGTAGTHISVLEGLTTRRFYPELWQARSSICTTLDMPSDFATVIRHD
jgi:tryptophan 2,3-dioxygenase